jgi:hypothetical protein
VNLRPLLSLMLLSGLAPARVAAPADPAAGGASGHARDGSAQPPRLWIMQNLWGLIAVPTKEAE